MKSIWLGILIGVEYLKRNRSLIILALIILSSIIFLQVMFNIFAIKNIVREGLVGTYQEHDLPLEVQRLLSQGLVEVDKNGRIQPKLVSGWETSHDATEFKFKLKEGLHWIDGSLIKSSDLEFNIPQTEVSYPDDRTIQFKLKESYSPLPSLLTGPIFKKGSLIGTGPYQIKNIEKSRIFITKIELEAQKEVLPKLYIRFYPNEKVALIGFNMGEVQVLLGVSNQRLLGDNPQVKSRQKTDFSKMVTILYNTKDALLANRSLRQALSFQAPMIEAEDVANNPFPPSSWAYNSDAKKYLNNPDEAKSALDRAKSAISEEKLHGELILTVTPNLEEVAKKIVKEWKSLGFDAKVRVESGIPQNFQAVLITQSIPDDPDQYFLWHSSQEKTNLSKYSQARADKDLEDARKAITEEDRKLKYFDFQKTLLEDSPATFLYFPKYNVLFLRKVEQPLDQLLKLQLL